jgi:hypothetical protein
MSDYGTAASGAKRPITGSAPALAEGLTAFSTQASFIEAVQH